MVISGTLPVTTLPAATTAPRPIVTSGMISAPGPTHAWSSIRTECRRPRTISGVTSLKWATITLRTPRYASLPIETSSGAMVSIITSVPMKVPSPTSTPRQRCRRIRVLVPPGRNMASSCSRRTFRPCSVRIFLRQLGRGLQLDQRHELPDRLEIVQLFELGVAESQPKGLLDVEDDVDIGERVPARDIRVPRFPTHHQVGNREDAAKDLLHKTNLGTPAIGRYKPVARDLGDCPGRPQKTTHSVAPRCYPEFVEGGARGPRFRRGIDPGGGLPRTAGIRGSLPLAPSGGRPGRWGARMAGRGRGVRQATAGARARRAAADPGRRRRQLHHGAVFVAASGGGIS